MKAGTTHEQRVQAAAKRRLRAQAAATTGPVGGLMDLRSEYVPSFATDIRKTFARARAEQEKGARL